MPAGCLVAVLLYLAESLRSAPPDPCGTRAIEVPTAPYEASWRSGYAEDCKSLHPGSIPGEASKTAYAVLPDMTSYER